DPDSTDDARYFNTGGHLKAGVSLANANARFKVATEEYRRKYPTFPKELYFGVDPLRESLVRGVRTLLLVLLGAVSFVLLIAGATVAILLLARAPGRRREMPIRAAVGAGRGRIIRQLLTESVLLSITGGLVGLVIGYLGIKGILSINPGNIPRVGLNGSYVSLDWLVGALLFGCPSPLESCLV